MAGESTFSKLKRVVEEEKSKKLRGEARLNSLEEEQNRIFAQVEEGTGQDVASVEEVEAICEKLKSDIESDISEMVKVLKEEGVEL